MTLRSTPVLLARTPDQIRPLAEAQGRNLGAERVAEYAITAFVAGCLASLALLISTGCAPAQGAHCDPFPVAPPLASEASPEGAGGPP